MVFEYLVWLVFAGVVVRAVWRLAGGVMEGLRGDVPARSVQMVRDPVCGTYVVPDRALAITDGSHQVFFCSANCRDKYRARTA